MEKNGFEVIRMDAIRESLSSKLEEMSELYGLPTDKVALLARKFKWDDDKMTQAWFSGQTSALQNDSLIELTLNDIPIFSSMKI